MQSPAPGKEDVTGEEQLCCQGPGEQQAEHEPAPEAKVSAAPRLYEQEQSQQSEGSDDPPLLSTS